MPLNPEVDQLLRNAACVELDDRAVENIRQACHRQSDWNKTIRQAESHGLAPYLYRQITDSGASVPDSAAKKLRALLLRHRESSRIRTAALINIVETYRSAGIEVLVLKGAALAHLIYDDPGLRPMSDIDILVAPDKLDAAAKAIGGLGYTEGGRTGLSDHHHLPVASRQINGLQVSVEIHHDALTRDNIGSIRLDRLSEPPRDFTINGVQVHTLGHIDMLRHLCRHALEPREHTKIGSALDIMTYAARQAEAIDWERLHQNCSEVVNTLRLLGYLVPWPAGLTRHLQPPPPRAPRGVGVGMIPLSSLRHRPGWPAKLFNPSDWWLHAFYNVPPGRSLVPTKLFRHPVRVIHWLWRRRSKAVG